MARAALSPAPGRDLSQTRHRISAPAMRSCQGAVPRHGLLATPLNRMLIATIGIFFRYQPGPSIWTHPDCQRSLATPCGATSPGPKAFVTHRWTPGLG